MVFVRLLMRSEPFPLSGPLAQTVSVALFIGAVSLNWAVRVRSAGAVMFATYATAAAFSPWLFANPIHPPTSMDGPMTIVVSSADDALYVYRNGNAIGRAAVQISGRGGLGNHVFTLLEGSTGKPSQLAPGREACRWMRVTSQGRPVEADDIASRIRFNTEFAQKLADEIKPGTTVIVTDQPVVRNPTADSTYFAAN